MRSPSDPAANPSNLPGTPEVPTADITGVILAGGLGRRMGGRDKGLLEIRGRPLVAHIIETLRPQVGHLVINANRNLDDYRALGLPVIPDRVGAFFGPLAGIASVLQTTDTPLLLTTPCDSPLIPDDLCARLYRTMTATDAEITVAHDGERMQQVFALLRRELLADLLDYLEGGGRRIGSWYAGRRLSLADFSDCPEAFLNVNTPEEWAALEAGPSAPKAR